VYISFLYVYRVIEDQRLMGSDLAQTASGRVEELGSPYYAQFRIGGVSVQVGGERLDDVTLRSSLGLFQAWSAAFDVYLRIERTRRLACARGRKLFDSGSVWRLYENEDGYRFDFSTPAMGDRPYKRLLVDSEFRHARLLMVDEPLRGAAPMDYPLDELLIMHRLTQEKAIELHGCGIVRADGTGNLFVGHSGAGKSTTTRLWTAHEDVEVLSDDRIIVRRDEGCEASVEMPFGGASGADDPGVPSTSTGQAFRLRDRLASPPDYSAQDDRAEKQVPPRAFSTVRNDRGAMRMYGTPWHGEAMYASPGSAGLARIFVLEHGQGNVLTRLTRSQAVGELFARSFVPFHRHGYVDSALEFLQELVDTVPCYRYSFEPDGRAVEKIVNFRD
jgi:hypothetical protein